MIKLNLIGDKVTSDVGGNYQLALYFLSVVCLIFGFWCANSFLKYNLELIVQEDKLLRAQLMELKKVTKEVRDLEKKRETLKSKLEIIDSLKNRKIGPVKMLDDLNLSVPEKSWIVEMRDKDSVLRIDGMALDNQTIADLIKQLEKSNYFIRVDLLEARQEEWQGVKMKRFAISAQINYGGPTSVKEEGPS
ncbi:MAG: PilN domain-containing protein [bacterium]|nr:PilN domain-containing protein [bacterium]